MSEQPSQQPVHDSGAGMFEFLTWLEVNKVRLAVIAVIAILAGVVIWLMGHFKEQKELNASSNLLTLRQGTGTEPGATSADFTKITEQYSGTTAAERALLLAATAAFTENQYDTAQKTFSKFLTDYPESPWAPSAAFGVAASAEALNRQDEALQAYQRVTTQFSKSAEAEDARIAMARIYEAKNQPELALKTLDEIMKPTAAGRSPAPDLVARREALLKKHPQLRPVVTPATNAVSPVTSLSAPIGNAATNK